MDYIIYILGTDVLRKRFDRENVSNEDAYEICRKLAEKYVKDTGEDECLYQRITSWLRKRENARLLNELVMGFDTGVYEKLLDIWAELVKGSWNYTDQGGVCTQSDDGRLYESVRTAAADCVKVINEMLNKVA